MTSIINVLLEDEHQLRKTCKNSAVNIKNQSSEKSNRKQSFFNSHHNDFLLTGVHHKYDVLFLSKVSQQQISIQVFLLSKLGQILKTPSEISRIELIQRCFNEQEFYRPSVNPITGFLYFKLDFFNFPKQYSQFKKPSTAHEILKRIEIEKLFSTLEKIQGIEKLPEGEQFQGWRAEEQRLRLSSAKAIARTIQGPNLEMVVSGQKEKNFNKQYNNTKLKNKYYQKLLECSNEREIFIDLNRIIQSLKEIQRVHPHLTSFIKKKSRRINFDPLFIDAEARAKLEEQMKEMCLNNIETKHFKVCEEVFGNINIKLQRLSLNAFNKMLQFFGSLSKTHEYENIEKYFDQKTNMPIKISLESKGQTLRRYLEKNANSISLETKMRILVQMYTFVNVLWEENELVFIIDNLNQVLVTKKLGVKIKSLDNFFKSQKQMIWQNIDLLNEKRSQSILNLSSLFFKIFYRLNILYSRPKVITSNSTFLMDECKLNGITRMNICKQLPKEVVGKTKQFLASVNYIFAQQVYTSGKIIKRRQKKELLEARKKEQMEGNKTTIQIGTDGSDQDLEQEDEEGSRILNTKHIACWLMSSI